LLKFKNDNTSQFNGSLALLTTCTRSWSSGNGCVYNETAFVYWIESNHNGGCCQMPAEWMTEPHDNGGNFVAPLPFPASEHSYGRERLRLPIHAPKCEIHQWHLRERWVREEDWWLHGKCGL